jgi:hypothetical protein
MAHFLTVGLLGDADRNSTWEQYLRPHPSVEKVVLTKSVKAIGNVDACIILNDLDALQQAHQLIKQGIHCFLVGKLPTDLPTLIKVQNVAEEAGTILQFANWSYFNPASLWMIDQMPKPRVIHFDRQVSSKSVDTSLRIDLLWIEDLALIMRWVNSGVFKIECQSVSTPLQTLTRNTWVQFDNGSTASMFHTLHANTDRHTRFATNEHGMLEADVLAKTVTATYFSDNKVMSRDEKSFQNELPAGQALNRFLKAIQMKSRSEYGIHDVVRLIRTVAKSNATVSK